MKKLIAHPLTWLLYYLGDLSCKSEIVPYEVYQYLMIWSLNIQEWGGLDSPWKSK